MKKLQKFSLLFLIIVLNLLLRQPVLAEEAIPGENLAKEEENSFSLVLDKLTAEKGGPIVFGDKFKLNIEADALKDGATIEIVKNPDFLNILPENKKLIGEIYQFDIKNKEVFNNKKPLRLEIGYDNYSDDLKKIYFWNSRAGQWQELPSTSDVKNKTVKSIIHLPYARVAILGDSVIKESGYASWYRYRGCDCAASPDYPKGTKIKVTNLVNDKSIIVRINDWGPERNIFPDRVIDLDVTVFKKIAKKTLGIVKVKIEPIL